MCHKKHSLILGIEAQTVDRIVSGTITALPLSMAQTQLPGVAIVDQTRPPFFFT
jgi:hypothetical protein